MKTKILLFGLCVLFASCNNENELALKDALNKANITITKQDSVLADKTYKCNYILTYTVNTVDRVSKNGGYYYQCDTTYKGTISAYLQLINIHYKTNVVNVKNFKNLSVYQVDSIIEQLHKKTLFADTITILAYQGFSDNKVVTDTIPNFLTNVSKINITFKTIKKLIYREIKISDYKLEKDYYNLNNVEKEQ